MLLKKKSPASQQNSIANDLSIDSAFGNLSDVTATAIDWLWEPYILFGALTIAEGDPGIGKSFLMMYLAAIVSRGGILPGGAKIRSGRVLYLSAEDDASFTIKPRIDKMQGDARRIRYLKKYLALNDKGFAILTEEMQNLRPDLVIIDPLYAFVGGDCDIYRPNEIREFLSQLADIAKTFGAAIVIVRHLRKGAGKALYRGAGLIDVIGAARSALLIAIHPEDEDLRVVAHSKHNLSRKGDSWLYELVSESEVDMPSLQWRGTCELSADDLAEGGPPDKSIREAAQDFLKEALKEGSCAQKDILEKAERENHKERTIMRAKKDLGVVSRRVGKVWMWTMPSKVSHSA